MFQSLDSFQPGSFEGWLHRITTNVFLDMARRRQRIRMEALPEETDRIAGREPSPEATFDAANLDPDLQAALDDLLPEFRAALVLCDVEGLSYEEIGQTLRREARHRRSASTAPAMRCAPAWRTGGPCASGSPEVSRDGIRRPVRGPPRGGRNRRLRRRRIVLDRVPAGSRAPAALSDVRRRGRRPELRAGVAAHRVRAAHAVLAAGEPAVDPGCPADTRTLPAGWGATR